MEEIRPNGERAKAAIIMICIVLAIDIAMFISDYFQFELLNRMNTGGDFSMDEATSNDGRQQALAVFYILAFVTSAVTFIRWFRRAYFNLHTKAEILSYPEKDALWSWFIPILCLFKPYRIMKELFSSTESILVDRNKDYQENLHIQLVGWWWTLWILNNFVGQAYFRYSLHAETAAELINSTKFSMVTSIFSIPLSIVAIILIRNYSAVEPLLYNLDEHTLESNDTEFLPEPIL
jgi:hypothetical protein